VKPFRFLADAFDATTAHALGDRARAAEALGVTTFVLPDHLIPQLAPIPYLAPPPSRGTGSERAGE